MVSSLPWAEGSAGPLAFHTGAWGLEQGWGGFCISMSKLRLLFLLVAGDDWGTAKGPKKSHSEPMRRGPSRPPPSEDNFFQGSGHLMSLFLCFVWLCHEPSVAACPLSSPSPSSPFPPLLTWETFPWKRALRGGEKELWQQCGHRRKELKTNRPAQGAVTKRGCEWRRRQGF